MTSTNFQTSSSIVKYKMKEKEELGGYIAGKTIEGEMASQ
jgi:hypothetical protein